VRKLIYSCYFDVRCHVEDRVKKFDRMSSVLRHTAALHSPGWDLIVEKIAAPESSSRLFVPRSGESSFATNTDKLRDWLRIVEALGPDDIVALLDADTMVLDSLDPILDVPFDAAITVKQDPKLPINGGVVFVRGGGRGLAFMRRWSAINDRMYRKATPQDAADHRVYRARYGGMNQAALGYLLDKGMLPAECHLERLPARVWNSCHDLTWNDWGNARVVHIKSNLRRAAFGGVPRSDGCRDLAAVWQRYDAVAAGGP
jgi:hypothetical protein